jgi:tetratricopeptide (TPR) repeat protein
MGWAGYRYSKIREDLPMKIKILSLISLVVLIALSACAGSKPEVQPEPVPVRNPLALAHQAAADGNDAYSEKLYNEAILAFTEAIALFNEAAPTAVPTDSITLNIEKMNLNIAKSHIDLAVESASQSMYDDAIHNYEKALGIYKTITPVHVSQGELDANILGVYNNLAIVQRRRKFEEAVGYYDQLLKLKPNDPATLNSKFFLLRDNQKDKTRAYAELIDLATATNDPAAYSIWQIAMLKKAIT